MYSVEAFTEEGERIGELSFSQAESDDQYTAPYWRFMWAHLDFLGDKFKKQGIGRAALEMWHECSREKAVVARNDGITREDGSSHLTGDAPGFVDRMVQEGLLLYEN
ncbi:hypothetical protein [Bradyrhizobium sp. CCBAU 53421]|uniref:hypothetical protein n=1 Tax=Bradyrhizobium sp. CCBAU 53421 TaxID=1325120 RepID=UPI00188A7706|nr:hypothetical protein [Bradyrhizobium sp. CCBAU 53421]